MRQLETLQRYFSQLRMNETLSHGYALVGKDRETPQSLMRYILQTVVCMDLRTNGEPCQQCLMCQRATEQQLADVYWLFPEGNTIKVEQIRMLREWLSQSPLDSFGKFAVIVDADKLTTSSANALLTVLEEPQGDTHLFLLTTQGELLLPTIRSRVQMIYIEANDVTTRRNELQAQGVLPHHQEVLLLMSDSMIARHIKEYDSQQVEKWLKSLGQWYRQVQQRDLQAFVTLQTQLKQELSQQMSLDCLEYWLKLTHELLTQQQPVFQQAYLATLIQQNIGTVADHLALYQLLLQAKQWIQANVSPQLALEQVIIQHCLS